MKKYNIYDVANFFLKIVDRDSGSTITPLKLQKILYYAQGYHLALKDIELFPEDFEAWAHGPVNEGIYNKYRDCGYNTIPEPTEDNVEFDIDTIDFLTDIWHTFGIYDGKYLEEQTHNESPWINARKGCKSGERCNVVISKESMTNFFKKVINENV